MDLVLERVPPPVPGDACEQQRVHHTRQRRRILTGQHYTDVLTRIACQVGTERLANWGQPDLSSNVLTASSSALATLYDPDDTGNALPTLACATDAHAGDVLGRYLDEAGIWPAMPRVQRDTLAMRENLVRLDVERQPGGVLLVPRVVPPDLVDGTPDGRNPQRAISIGEWRWYAWGWVREVWTTWPVPSMRYEDSAGHDVSPQFGLPAGGLVGSAYPLFRSDGVPILPYVLYHAALGTGALWDPYTGIDVVDGTLQCAVLWTFYGHILRNAAWAQRYTIGAEPDGGVNGINGSTQVVADPAVVLRLRAEEGFDGQPQAGQWATTADPRAVAESIGIYERRLHSAAGLDPSDVQRISGDPRSGYALEISRKSKDQSAMRYAPIFARPDAELCSLAAVLLNRELGPHLPDRGWAVTHAPIRAIQLRAQAGAGGELAGAQTQALAAIVAQVAKGELPHAGARAILQRSFSLDEATAEGMLSGADELATRALAGAARAAGTVQPTF